jgi:hypothetical protein
MDDAHVSSLKVGHYYPSMPLGLAGLRELIRRRPPPAVRPFYSNFDWLEGLASCPATNLLCTVPSLDAGTTDCLPVPPSCFPATHVSFFIGGGMLGPSGATL